jgi:hypothetical protein
VADELGVESVPVIMESSGSGTRRHAAAVFKIAVASLRIEAAACSVANPRAC